jgi:hypothetical protein
MMDGATTSHSLWLRGTPLGRASVPEVQQIVNTSLAVTAASRSAWASRCVSAGVMAAAQSRDRSMQPDAGSSPQARMLRRCGACACICANMAAAACPPSGFPMRANVTTAAAWVCARMWSSSFSRYCTGTGVTTMPSRAHDR